MVESEKTKSTILLCISLQIILIILFVDEYADNRNLVNKLSHLIKIFTPPKTHYFRCSNLEQEGKKLFRRKIFELHVFRFKSGGIYRFLFEIWDNSII